MAGSNRIPTPFGQRLKRARIGALPLLIWLAGGASAAKLWLAAPRHAVYHGLAHAAEVQVTSPVDGALERLLVGLYQTVGAGEVVATLDDAALEAEIETARAELARLVADVQAARADIEAQEAAARRDLEQRHGLATSAASLEFPAELRAFHADEAMLELQILETRLAITVSELEADRLDVRLQRAEAMVKGSIGPIAEVEDLQKLRVIEVERARSLVALEAGVKVELERARQRRLALEGSYAGPSAGRAVELALDARTAGWREAVVVQQKRLDELALRRGAYVLRAPASGRVAELLVSEGQYVLAGDPILLLLDAQSHAVALWVPETAPVPPSLGDRFVVTRQVDFQTEVREECTVLSMSPRFELVPQRLWRDPRVAEYGRAHLIGPVSRLGLVSGERVGVDRVADGSSGDARPR